MATTPADHTPQLDAAIAQLATLNYDTWGDLGQHMTCTEANIIVNLLRAIGQADSAEILLEKHSEADDSGDEHWVEPVEIDIEDALDAAGDAYLNGRDRSLPDDYAEVDAAVRQSVRDSLGTGSEGLTHADVATAYAARMTAALAVPA